MTSPVPVRLAKYTDKSGGPDACWPWTGGTVRGGYGALKVNGRKRMATHLVYELDRGHPPEKPWVLHTCDNPPCVNPRHLWSGTQLDNVRDMVSKGRARAPRGEDHSMAQLTTGQVIELRTRYTRGGITHRKLAVEYGVATAVVSRIIRRETWRHVA